MTLENAITQLQAIEKKYIHGGDEGFDKMRKCAIKMAISALRAQAEADKNEPLTEAQLREMDAEAVYVTSYLGEEAMWYIVDVAENELKNPWNRITLEDWDGGWPYRAYRRKPKEVARDD